MQQVLNRDTNWCEIGHIHFQLSSQDPLGCWLEDREATLALVSRAADAGRGMFYLSVWQMKIKIPAP